MVDPTSRTIVSSEDYEELAHQLLHPSVWAYFDGGAEYEQTLQRNRIAWRQVPIQSHVLRPDVSLDLTVNFLGQLLPCPIVVAPMAHLRLAHPQAESGLALACASQGVGFTLSTLSSTLLEEPIKLVKNDAGRGPAWFQSYFLGTRDDSLALINRAIQAGYEAIVLTVDAPIQGLRDRERRAAFQLPPGICAVNLEPDRHTFQSRKSVRQLLEQAPDWSTVEWIKDQIPVPLILKGITSPLDVERAIDAGVDAVIVSNHGGRVLDGLPATAEVLPACVSAARGRIPLLVDGGIKRGSDIYRALELGANMVLVGRAALYALAADGAQGAAHLLRILKDELLSTIALTGSNPIMR